MAELTGDRPDGRDMKVMHQLLQDAARAANAHNTCDSRVGRFVADGQTYNTPFDVQDVRLRRTWRGAWTRECPAPDDVAEAIDSAKRWGYRIVAMSTKESRPLLLAANRWFFRDRGIARELARWTRLTPRRPRYREDGLNDVMLVLTPLERWVFRSLIRPSIYAWARGLGGAELLARASAGATRGIVLTPTENRASIAD